MKSFGDMWPFGGGGPDADDVAFGIFGEFEDEDYAPRKKPSRKEKKAAKAVHTAGGVGRSAGGNGTGIRRDPELDKQLDRVIDALSCWDDTDSE